MFGFRLEMESQRNQPFHTTFSSGINAEDMALGQGQQHQQQQGHKPQHQPPFPTTTTATTTATIAITFETQEKTSNQFLKDPAALS